MDFTKEMKKSYTILAPDIFPIHMYFLEEIFRLRGYNFKVVHYEGKEVIDTGLKYLHNDMCYPAICSLGQLLYALECGDYDVNKTALIFFRRAEAAARRITFVFCGRLSKKWGFLSSP